MKLFKVIISVLLCFVMLTANVSAFSIEADYKDMPKKYWACEYVMQGRKNARNGGGRIFQ